MCLGPTLPGPRRIAARVFGRGAGRTFLQKGVPAGCPSEEAVVAQQDELFVEHHGSGVFSAAGSAAVCSVASTPPATLDDTPHAGMPGPRLKPFRRGSNCWRIIRMFEANGWALTGELINERVELARKWTNRISDIRKAMNSRVCIACKVTRGVNREGKKITKTLYWVPVAFQSRMRALVP